MYYKLGKLVLFSKFLTEKKFKLSISMSNLNELNNQKSTTTISTPKTAINYNLAVALKAATAALQKSKITASSTSINAENLSSSSQSKFINTKHIVSPASIGNNNNTTASSNVSPASSSSSSNNSNNDNYKPVNGGHFVKIVTTKSPVKIVTTLEVASILCFLNFKELFERMRNKITGLFYKFIVITTRDY
jgi:hypothetical protein